MGDLSAPEKESARVSPSESVDSPDLPAQTAETVRNPTGASGRADEGKDSDTRTTWSGKRVALIVVAAVVFIGAGAFGLANRDGAGEIDQGPPEAGNPNAVVDAGAEPSDSDGPTDSENGPTLAAVQAAVGDEGTVLRLTGTRDESALGMDYKVVQFELERPNTAIYDCGAEFRLGLRDQWEMGAQECDIIQAADLSSLPPPGEAILHDLGCGEFLSTNPGEACEIEIQDTSETTYTACGIEGAPDDTNCFFDEPVIEILTDMTRSKWGGGIMREVGPATCSYGFYFRRLGDNWIIVDHGIQEDYLDCPPVAPQSAGQDSVVTTIAPVALSSEHVGLVYSGLSCRETVVTDGDCPSPGADSWRFTLSWGEPANGQAEGVFEFPDFTGRHRVLVYQQGGTIVVTELERLSGTSSLNHCSYVISELSVEAIGGTWNCGGNLGMFSAST